MKQKIIFVAIFAILAIGFLNCAKMSINKEYKIIALWESVPPTENGLAEPEEWNEKTGDVIRTSKAELYIYKASHNASGKVIIICPGGGYAGLAFKHEGKDVAEWLNSIGITAIVLKYRMPNYNSNIPLEDGQEAIRYVRKNAKELEVDPNQVGILGFSAGGHLASAISTHYAKDGISTRPDFSVLFYPVVTMREGTHEGSKLNLLGENPSEELIQHFSNEEQVTKDTPPTILLLSDDDKTVPSSNSVKYYEALQKNNVKATMYIFPIGEHGWGFNKDFRYHNEMKQLLELWLQDLKL